MSARCEGYHPGYCTTPTCDDAGLMREVRRSRDKAHAKHGQDSIEAQSAASPRWLAILGEEFGEVCRALTYDGTSDLRAELIDVLAVASAWVDAIDLGPAEVPA